MVEKKVPACCKECGKELLEVPWNTTVDLVKCENTVCRLFAVPVGTIPHTRGSLKDELASIARRPKGPKGRVSKYEVEYEGTEGILEELQGLRESFPSKKE